MPIPRKESPADELRRQIERNAAPEDASEETRTEPDERENARGMKGLNVVFGTVAAAALLAATAALTSRNRGPKP